MMSALSHAVNAARLERLLLYDYGIGRAGLRVFLMSDGRCAVSRITAKGIETRYEYRVDHVVVQRFEAALETCEYAQGVARIDLTHLDSADIPMIAVCFAAGVAHVVLGRDDDSSAWYVLSRGLRGLAEGLDEQDLTYVGPLELNWLPSTCT